MDFMKVFDQTVREIKREVNLKVLKVPEIEQKVLDATEDEPWGPHGTVLAEIAQATKKFSECQLVMNVLWTRLTETGKCWRFVYKSLAVIEYLVAHGSERAVDDIVEHTYQISSLVSFEYVEPNGKDLGINVRKKAETIVALLNDKDKIQQARNKASANREKYVGLSSSGITYKSGSAASFSSGFKNSDRYGGFGNTGDGETFTDSLKYGEDRYVKTSKKKEPSRYDSSEQESPATASTRAKPTKSDKHASTTSQTTQSDKYDEDFDDFDPRGTSSTKPSAGSNQVDLFGANFVDLFDAPVSVSVPTEKSTTYLDSAPPEVDLFADAAFVSAPSQEVESVKAQTVDLFAQQPAPSSTMDFFAAPDSAPQPENKASKPADVISSTLDDPFAVVPLNDFSGSDPFGAFTSQTDPLSTVYNQSSSIDGNVKGSSPTETKHPLQNEAFQVKSGIWSDSLSRGLIDLNITAPTKVNLAGVGIVGGLSDGTEEKDKRPLPSSFYMGGGGAMGMGMGGGGAMGMSMGGGGSMGMGMGSGVGGKAGGFTSTLADDDGFFSSLSTGNQHQFGGFQK